MFRAFLLALVASMSLVSAPGASVSAQDQNQDKPKKPYTLPPEASAPQKEGTQTVIVNGCVSPGSTAGSYILSAVQNPLSSQMSQRMSGTVPTPTYQLYGHTSELQGLIGRRVEVKGTTQKSPEKTVDAGQQQQVEQPKAQGTSGKKPTVKTDAKEKVEIRRLDVQSVTATQGTCK